MLQVTQLYIYPIKSLGGISLSAVNITDRGFEYDRRWMLVDENNRFISQRESNGMALLQVEVLAGGLKVSHKKEPGNFILVPFGPYRTDTASVQIWDATCEASFVSREADEWFSKALNISCRLVYMNDNSHVLVDERYNTNHDLTNFSDGFPILMISEASLNNLNSKASEQLPMNRFRPNLVIAGCNAHDEDTMKEFVINELVFFGVKPSARCVITTIDQATAEKGKEPLKTLATYRGLNNKIYFGENVIAKDQGKIKVGDAVNILQTKEGLFQ